FTPRVITVGGAHTCALTAAGVAYCWGDNGLGQLGIGQRIELAKSATKVATNHAFVSLVAGGLHTCGLTAAGEAYCWGANYSGQLGSLGETSVPVRVGVVPPLVELVAGSYHTCGLTRDGVVYCWGDNTLGQIGDGIDRSWAMSPGSTVTPPIAVGGALRFVSIGAAWATTCAIATTGETYCWGSNQDRELGAETATRCRIAADPYYNKTDYDAPCSTRPVRFDVGVRLASLTAYATDWCGVSVDGEIWCWGAGLIGSRNAAPRRFSKAWIVEHAVCGLEESASVSCWRPWSRPGVESPRPFGSTLALTDLSSSSHSCGLSRDAPREAFCWGANYRGEIGDGTTIYRPVPRRVLPPPP
ncbi:MAG TPA: hypothetical protein VJ717_10915, partial [Gemmatimonadaceae bacterium]|nr:hypothetical protein [Gemmatimonadaceae bacterium]